METLSPTQQRMKRAQYGVEGKYQSQTTDRRAHKIVSAIDHHVKHGDFEEHEAHAAAKLYMHFFGALGHKVCEPPPDYQEALEYGRTYHAQMLALAQDAVTVHRVWQALIDVLVEETKTARDIGITWRGSKNDKTARRDGVAMLKVGLESLAEHWDLAPAEP